MRHFLSSQEAEALKVHNDARRLKGCQPLQWDASLAKHAYSYAATLAALKRMEHSGIEEEGENLFMSDGDAIMPDAVRAWLREESDYHNEKIGEGDPQAYGHYTQCMWHETTHVGIGVARTLDGWTFIVARYSPPGNMCGERPY